MGRSSAVSSTTNKLVFLLLKITQIESFRGFGFIQFETEKVTKIVLKKTHKIDDKKVQKKSF